MRPTRGSGFERRFSGRLAGLAFMVMLVGAIATAGDLVRTVRLKLSAGDLASGESALETYKRATGIDPEYLDAVGWLARGSQMLGRPDVAAGYVAELRREIPEERPDLVVPLGAAIEVEGKLRAAREGRGSALRFLEGELARATDVALRARIRKNINLLSLEGQPAPEITYADSAGPVRVRLSELKGKPVLLFLWAPWCGDCKAQAASLAGVYRKYHPQGLTLIAPTRLYGFGAEGAPPSPVEEKAAIEKAWAETYKGFEGVSVPIDTETMVRYGASSTPSFVLVDRKGVVRFYTPTRLTEAALSRRIEEVLAEAP
jgi:thiol-disulfide isomerase/thioredoxin